MFHRFPSNFLFFFFFSFMNLIVCMSVMYFHLQNSQWWFGFDLGSYCVISVNRALFYDIVVFVNLTYQTEFPKKNCLVKGTFIPSNHDIFFQEKIMMYALILDVKCSYYCPSFCLYIFLLFSCKVWFLLPCSLVFWCLHGVVCYLMKFTIIIKRKKIYTIIGKECFNAIWINAKEMPSKPHGLYIRNVYKNIFIRINIRLLFIWVLNRL